MESFPDLTTEAKCRELIDRYPDNSFLKHRLALILRSEGRNDEASEVLSVEPFSLKYEMGLLTYDERIRRNPDDFVAYLNRGLWHAWYGSYWKALSDYDMSIMIDPTIAYAFCARASLRAICPDELFRDGLMALEDGRKALSLAEQAGELIGDWRHRLYIQVLAAAHAANGYFDEAIVLQTSALDLALTKLARTSISQRLEHYRSGKPIRHENGFVRCGFSRSYRGAGSPELPAESKTSALNGSGTTP